MGSRLPSLKNWTVFSSSISLLQFLLTYVFKERNYYCQLSQIEKKRYSSIDVFPGWKFRVFLRDQYEEPMSFKILSFSLGEIKKKTSQKIRNIFLIFENVHFSKPAVFIKLCCLQPSFGRSISQPSVLPRADIIKGTWCLKPTAWLFFFCTKESPIWKE